VSDAQVVSCWSAWAVGLRPVWRRHGILAPAKLRPARSTFDTSNGVERRLTLVPAPYHLNTIRATGEVYVSSRNAPKIWIVDQKTLKLVGEIALPGGEGHQMAVVK
jgi:hypothetical protein